MKRLRLQTDRRLVLSLETLRLIAGAGDALGPEPTHSSTALSCQTTKYACCG